MAYFPNGTAWMCFEERWCSNCAHGGDYDAGCPIANAHFLYSYDLCNESEHPGKIILDMLIPEEPPKEGAHCAMFVENTKGAIEAAARKMEAVKERQRYERALAEMKEAQSHA